MGQPVFKRVTPTDAQIGVLLIYVVGEVLRYLTKKGYLDKEGEVVDHPGLDPLYKDYESMRIAVDQATGGLKSFAPDTGQKVTKIRSGFGYAEETPFPKGKRCHTMNGFSIHANRQINTLRRKELYSLITYVSRGPISNDRIELITKDRVQERLKRPFSDGTTHLEMSASQFISRLCDDAYAPLNRSPSF